LEGRISGVTEQINRMRSQITDWYGKSVAAQKAVKELNSLFEEMGLVEKDYQADEQREPNELEFVIQDHSENTLKETIIRLSQIPDSLPVVGQLYTAGHRNYLSIQTVEEIGQARREAERFNALIVTEGGNNEG
ncbi:MAG: hypothetical protein D6778_02935, partial [Nitrospirae bacterium]